MILLQKYYFSVYSRMEQKLIADTALQVEKLQTQIETLLADKTSLVQLNRNYGGKINTMKSRVNKIQRNNTFLLLVFIIC